MAISKAKSRLIGVSLLPFAAVAWSQAAHAQQAPDATPAQAAPVPPALPPEPTDQTSPSPSQNTAAPGEAEKDIVVTGSRVARQGSRRRRR